MGHKIAVVSPSFLYQDIDAFWESLKQLTDELDDGFSIIHSANDGSGNIVYILAKERSR